MPVIITTKLSISCSAEEEQDHGKKKKALGGANAHGFCVHGSVGKVSFCIYIYIYANREGMGSHFTAGCFHLTRITGVV